MDRISTPPAPRSSLSMHWFAVITQLLPHPFPGHPESQTLERPTHRHEGEVPTEVKIIGEPAAEGRQAVVRELLEPSAACVHIECV